MPRFPSPAEVERPAERFVFPEILGFPVPGMVIAHDVSDLVKTREEAGEPFRSGDEDPLAAEIQTAPTEHRGHDSIRGF